MREQFNSGDHWETHSEYPVAVCSQGDWAFIGKYGLQQRTLGTDTLPYNSLPKILETIDMLCNEQGSGDYRWDGIVCEGDRINNDRFFTHCLKKGYPCVLWLVEAPVETSLARLQRAGSKITRKFVEGTRTKSLNNFNKYASLMHGRRVRGG